MTTFQQAVRAALVADVTLAALTSLILDDDNVGRDGLQRTQLLATQTSTSISPAIFIKWRSELPYQLRVLKAEQYFFEIYFYQEQGYGTCEAMRRRVFALLHEQRIAFTEPTGNYCHLIYGRGHLTRLFDPAMEGVSMENSRYEAHITRPTGEV